MSTSIAILKEALNIVRNFNIPQKVVDSIATAESYLEGDKSDVLHALQELQNAVNSISTGRFNSNLYVLDIQRKSRTEDYNSLCDKISEIHKGLGHPDPSLRWLERKIPIQVKEIENARKAAGGFGDIVEVY